MDQPLYSNMGFEQALEIRKAATFPIELQVVDADDLPFDLSDCEIRASVVLVSDPTVGVDFVFEQGGADGVAHGEISAEDTATLTAVDKRIASPLYRWACDIKQADQTIVPFCHGDVFVRNSDVNWS